MKRCKSYVFTLLALAALFYADVKGIVDTNCVTCHQPGHEGEDEPLTSLEGIKAVRNTMIRKIERCKMPPKDKEFCRSAEAEKLLDWLKNGSDLSL